MYKSPNIKKMRLYFEYKPALEALRWTNIELIMGVPNEKLQSLASNPAAASSWVQEFVLSYTPGVRFKYIAVGNEQIPYGSTAQYILPAMGNIYAAIQAAGLQNQIKVSTAIHTVVVRDSYPPSRTTFTDEAATYMGPIALFLSDTGAPLLVNVYPYFAYIGDKVNIPLSFATFTYQGIRFSDGNYQYGNLFDAMVDGLYWAMEKIGAGNVRIVISESGWPSEGGDSATISNAKTYNQGLICHLGSGTPKRPQSIEAYVFAMFNENLKQPPGIENNFGLFYPNRTAVYPINFSC